MSIYDEMQSVASEVLSEFKHGTIKLVSVTSGTGAADDPGAPTEVVTALDAVVKGAPFKYVRDGFAVSTDLMVTAAVIDGITPSVNDFIEIDSIRYKIVQDVSAPAAGTRIVWKFLVRK